MQRLTEKFIILKKTKYSESDLILQALATNGSRSSFIARSALKSKKRFGGGVLEPLHFVSFTYKPGRELGHLHTLEEAQLVHDFKNIRRSYDALEMALHFLDCVYKVSLEGDVGGEFLFNLTGNALRAIETFPDDKKFLQLKLHFYLKLLFQQGVISPEPWMHPFLKSNLIENSQLDIGPVVDEYLSSIELLIIEYLKSASV